MNSTRVGWKLDPAPSSPILGLIPHQITLGCHKDIEGTYDFFNDADVDEFAIWKRALDEEEIVYFSGGYGAIFIIITYIFT